MRICSFQPGATEIVYALGLQEQLVGVTSKCDYPAEVREKPTIVRNVFDSTHLTSGGDNPDDIPETPGRPRPLHYGSASIARCSP